MDDLIEPVASLAHVSKMSTKNEVGLELELPGLEATKHVEGSLEVTSILGISNSEYLKLQELKHVFCLFKYRYI